MFSRPIARLVTRSPKLILGGWVLLMVALSLWGVGLDEKVATRPVFISGSESERANEIAVRRFGSNEAIIVMLRGPQVDVARQGPGLTERLDALPGTLVVSPWDSAQPIPGLSPRPGVAAILVDIQQGHDRSIADAVSSLEREVDLAVRGRVRVSVAGGPPLLDSIHSAAEDAATFGEAVALPTLLVVLLLVFRSVIAAAIPVVMGGSVVAAAKGVVDLSLGLVPVESFALGAIGMMGLALGVDYSLLVVSRFREEMRGRSDPAAAVQATVAATGRAILAAGAGLILAMLVAAQALSSPLIVSAAWVIGVVTVLSVLAAVLVVPALLMVLGSNVDRWAWGGRRQQGGVATRWSQTLSSRPRFVVLIAIVLLACAGWAFTLDTRVADVALLPPGDEAREQFEAVETSLGPGWVSPIEILMDGNGGPVTTPDRLRALGTFQRKVEDDPGVRTMAGLKPLESATTELEGAEDQLVALDRNLARVNRALTRVHEGTGEAARGVSKAADGAQTLHSAIDQAAGGSEDLANGLNSASQGSTKLATGLRKVDRGGGALATGVTRASEGSGRLSAALIEAREQAAETAAGAKTLKEALRAGEKRLEGLHPRIQRTEERLTTAEQALEQMTLGRGDPRYEEALQAVHQAQEEVTGRSSTDGAPIDPTFNGVEAEIQLAQNQFDLGIFLAKEAEKSGREGQRGIRRLAEGSTRLDSGLERLAAGQLELSDALAELSRAGQIFSPAIGRLSEGSGRLANGLAALGGGSGVLATKLRRGGESLQRLSDGTESAGERIKRESSSNGLSNLTKRSPGLFRSGYFYLASLDGAHPRQRNRAAFLINLDRGGTAARMLVIPRYEADSAETQDLTDRLREDASRLASNTGTEVAVGGAPVSQLELNHSYRDQAPFLRLALMIVTAVVLILVLRALIVPFLAAILNLVTVAAGFGIVSLLFNGSLLGGPGFVDASIIPAAVMVMFGLALDYEVFIFARMREEYLRTRSANAAIANGIRQTAQVVSGAATIMILVFLAFSLSPFATIRNFGVALAVAVAIDAYVVRLVIVPAMMRGLGKWAWWMPRWLDRLLPGFQANPATARPERAAQVREAKG